METQGARCGGRVRQRSKFTFVASVFLTMLLALSACGGGGSNNDGAPALAGPAPVVAPPGAAPPGGAAASGGDAAMGTLSIAFSDAPLADDFEKAVLVIRQIRLVPDDLSGRNIDVLSEPLTLDLLQLTGHSEVLLALEVPRGVWFSVIRFELESLTLYRSDGSVVSVSLVDLGQPAILEIVSTDQVGNRSQVGVSISNPSGTYTINIEFPLDLALKESANGYEFRPVVFVGPPDALFRLSGTVVEIPPDDDGSERSRGFRLCDLDYRAFETNSAGAGDTCASITSSTDIRYFDSQAVIDAAGRDSLTLGDSVVVYGWYDYYSAVSDIMAFQALAVARGTGFERRRGIASDFNPAAEYFDINSSNPLCTSTESEISIRVAEGVPVHRTTITSSESVGRLGIRDCLGVDVEGYRVTPGELRAFFVNLRPETLSGVLTRSSVPQSGRYDLMAEDGTVRCVLVDESSLVIEYFYRSMGIGHVRSVIGNAVNRETVISGERDAGGCFRAQRVVYFP